MDSTVAQLILNDRKIAYAITDRALTVVEVSGAVDILRRNGGAILGRSLIDLVPELVGSEERLAAILDGQAPSLHLPWVNRDTAGGQVRYLTLVELPHRDRAGRIIGLIHLAEDTTELGQLEQRLTQQRNELRFLRDELSRQNKDLTAANADLRRLDDLKSAFVSIAAHELRTPLAAIQGYLEMVLDGEGGPLTARQTEYLQIIQRSTQRLTKITSDLLDLTRIEVGRIELALRPVDMSGLIEAVAAEQAPQFQAKAQRLTLRAPQGLPPSLADSDRIAQVMGNLLSNASKYTPEGGIVTVTLTLAAEPGFLQISVADNGVGISATDQARLFERFYRGSGAAAVASSGVGLGLYITRALVDLHGGRIWLESQPDVGTTFHVTVPVADHQPGPEVEPVR